jgi:hypothetical protein
MLIPAFHLTNITTGFGVGAASVGDTGWVTTAGAGILCCPACYLLVFSSGGFECTFRWGNSDGCAHMISSPQADIAVFHLANVTTSRTVAGRETNPSFAVGTGIAIFELVLHLLG